MCLLVFLLCRVLQMRNNLKETAVQDHVAVLGALFGLSRDEVQKSPLRTMDLNTILDILGVPRFYDIYVCNKCGTAYGHEDLKWLQCHADGAHLCDFIAVPGALNPTPCGNALEKKVEEIKLADGRIKKVLEPVCIAKRSPVIPWLQYWAKQQTRQQLKSSLHDWEKEPPDPDMVKDFYGSRAWSSKSACWRDPAAEWVGFALSYDGVQPFRNDPSVPEEHQNISIGVIHLTVLNLPRQQRFDDFNVCTAFIIEGINYKCS